MMLPPLPPPDDELAPPPASMSVPSDPVDPAAPAMRYGKMDRGSCEAELERRHVGFVRVDEARGVLAPIRLTGPVHGVRFHGMLPDAQRATTPYEIVDCRLALALDDFATILRGHDVVEVVHYSMYRPPARSWPEAKLAARHPGGLAIDAATFVKGDGTRLHVERDFHGRIGAKTCGPGTGPSPATPEALELRAIVCEAIDAKLFNVALTPDYNWPHRNHFHLEVTASSRGFYVR
jgi:hypothetical protein